MREKGSRIFFFITFKIERFSVYWCEELNQGQRSNGNGVRQSIMKRIFALISEIKRVLSLLAFKNNSMKNKKN